MAELLCLFLLAIVLPLPAAAFDEDELSDHGQLWPWTEYR